VVCPPRRTYPIAAGSKEPKLHRRQWRRRRCMRHPHVCSPRTPWPLAPRPERQLGAHRPAVAYAYAYAYVRALLCSRACPHVQGSSSVPDLAWHGAVGALSLLLRLTGEGNWATSPRRQFEPNDSLALHHRAADCRPRWSVNLSCIHVSIYLYPFGLH
jgi:hypothetical protein